MRNYAAVTLTTYPFSSLTRLRGSSAETRKDVLTILPDNLLRTSQDGWLLFKKKETGMLSNLQLGALPETKRL